MPTKKQRQNLAKLAIYLESLPPSYKHFDMQDYADHNGVCQLADSPRILAAKKPNEFLANCGTVACAAGHGPAAGIKFARAELRNRWVLWSSYVGRVFGAGEGSCDDENGELFDFLFASFWQDYDNHHYGAAARIRYFLATGEVHTSSRAVVPLYAPYRKGSRSKARRQSVEAFSA